MNEKLFFSVSQHVIYFAGTFFILVTKNITFLHEHLSIFLSVFQFKPRL